MEQSERTSPLCCSRVLGDTFESVVIYPDELGDALLRWTLSIRFKLTWSNLGLGPTFNLG